MIIETILVILGILTTVLGIWNIIIGAYVWGGLFLIGGIWAIGLGSIYIVQLRKERKKKISTKNNLDTSNIEILGAKNSITIPDEGIQAESLFEEPIEAPTEDENDITEEVSESDNEVASESEKPPAAKWRESEEVVTSEEEVAEPEETPFEISAVEETGTEESTKVNDEEIDAINIVLIDENINDNQIATEEEIEDFNKQIEKAEESTDEERVDETEIEELEEAIQSETVIEEEQMDYISIVESTNQLVTQDENSMSLMISETSTKDESNENDKRK